MRKILIVAVLLVSTTATAQSRYPGTPWRLYLELDQMFMVKVGTEYSITPGWGVKGAIGITPFGLTTVGYELAGVWHLMDVKNRFQIDFEFGLPLAYFDVLEGNLVDRDPMVDDPYVGFAPGVSLAWSYQSARGRAIGAKTGALAVFEYQRNRGWRMPLLVMPELSLQWQAGWNAPD